MTTSAPEISVIIPTYNYSGVLRYAIESVLAQTHTDFELLVIGDHCTDDTESVVRSFGDPRIRWHNLPINSGQKAVPCNKGLELSRGPYVAYLGQDDLWLPDHLETALRTIHAHDADIVYALTLDVALDGSVGLQGLSPTGEYIPNQMVNFISIMHRRDLMDDVGTWPEFSDIRQEPPHVLFRRVVERGKRFVCTDELTAIKIVSTRRNLYVDKPTETQHRLATEMRCPDFRYRMLTRVLKEASGRHPGLIKRFAELDHLEPGEGITRLREFKGLVRTPGHPPAAAEDADSAADIGSADFLSTYNHHRDITPLRYRMRLHHHHEVPQNGLFLGRGWSSRIEDSYGGVRRQLYDTAELVVTNPTNDVLVLCLDLTYIHPGGNTTAKLRVTDTKKRPVAEFPVGKRTMLALRLPLPDREPTTFHLSLIPDGPDGDAGPGYVEVFELEVVDVARDMFLHDDVRRLRNGGFTHARVERKWVLD